MPRRTPFVVVALVVATACTENVAYRASALPEAGPPQLIAEGALEYWPAFDVLVAEGTGEDGSVFWSKGVSLFDAWLLVAHVTREEEVRGFGLSIKNGTKPNGFSWEWFDKHEGEVFRKRQGAGTVRGLVDRGLNYEELTAVEFLEDVTLRYLDDMTAHDPGEHTHEVVIRKGSLLRLAP